MDMNRFGELARSLATSPSRRAVCRTVACLAAGSILAPLIEPITGAAKKKRKHKKKKRCKSGTRKCGKQCIAATACCSSAECSEGGSCVGGTCQCASGFHDCQGECTPDDTCCATDIGCFDAGCCDGAAGEVCHDSGAVRTCEAGGCPEVGLCSVLDVYICSGDLAFPNDSCMCTTAIDGAESVCVAVPSFDCNNTCTASSGCGEGAVCIANDAFCGCEETVVGFCATLCDEVAAPRARRPARRPPFDMTALQRGLKQPNHR